MGSMNAITYKEIFPLIKNNKLWSGVNFNKQLKDKLDRGYINNKRKYARLLIKHTQL